MKKLFLLLLLCHVSSPVSHSLTFLFTASTGIQRLPDVMVVMLVDGVVSAYCDSNMTKAEPRNEWFKKLLEDDPEEMESQARALMKNMNIFKGSYDSVKRHLNQSGGVHTLQRISGCKWDDETGELHAFVRFGYDGEDYLTLDLNTETWIAHTPKAVITKHAWDRPEVNLIYKSIHTELCPQLLKKFIRYGQSSLQRTVLPSMSLLQKSPSSPVCCHATGFYPDKADIFWRKEGQQLHEDVDYGELLPNHDGTFQMSVDLNLSSAKTEDWEKYECVFQLAGVKEDIIMKLGKPHFPVDPEFPAGPVIGGVVALLILVVCITAVFVWKRKKSGFRAAKHSAITMEGATIGTDVLGLG